jgi:hypothetical protein
VDQLRFQVEAHDGICRTQFYELLEADAPNMLSGATKPSATFLNDAPAAMEYVTTNCKCTPKKP